MPSGHEVDNCYVNHVMLVHVCRIFVKTNSTMNAPNETYLASLISWIPSLYVHVIELCMQTNIIIIML